MRLLEKFWKSLRLDGPLTEGSAASCCEPKPQRSEGSCPQPDPERGDVSLGGAEQALLPPSTFLLLTPRTWEMTSDPGLRLKI